MAWPTGYAPFSNNRTPLLAGLDVNDGKTEVPVAVDPATGALIVESGDVVLAGVAYIGAVPRASIGDQLTTITASTAVTTIVTANATHYLDLVSLVFSNISATGTEVQLFNDDGTTQRMDFWVPANDTRGIVFSTPFTQTAVNKTWKLKTVTSITSLLVTAQFVLNT